MGIDGGLAAIAALMPVDIYTVLAMLGGHGSIATAPIHLGAETLDLADILGIQ